MSESESPDAPFDKEEVSFWSRVIYTSLAILFMLVPWNLFVDPFLSALRLYFKTLPAPVADGIFVDRPELQEELLAGVNHKESFTVLLYGDRGGGKTSLIERALSGRRGTFTISITQQTNKEAQDQMLDRISSELHIFGLSGDVRFIKKVFSSRLAVEHQIVVVSVEAKCCVEVLEGVIARAKEISFDNRHQKHPRIIIDVSASRAAIEAGTQLKKRRVVGIHVGRFLKEEATKFVSERIRTHFVEPVHGQKHRIEIPERDEFTQLVLDKFDWHVLALQEICQKIREGKPKGKTDVEDIVDAAFEGEKEAALLGWVALCKNLETELGFRLSPDARQKILQLLLASKQKTSKIIAAIEEHAPGEARSVTRKDIGLANADCDYHPLFMNPFGTDMSLAGKVVEAALNEHVNGNAA